MGLLALALVALVSSCRASTPTPATPDEPTDQADDQRSAPASTEPRSALVIANGVRLHYLDWGGEGEVVLFLPGMGNSAYVFSDFAPLFREGFHPIALTRRGHGQSEAPESGYDSATLAEDVRGLMDALDIERAHLVGHSIAGAEMTSFAARYPDRVGKVVYLDAAYQSNGPDDFAGDPGIRFYVPRKRDRASFEALSAWYEGQIGASSPAMERELHESRAMRDGLVLPTLSPEVSKQLVEGKRTPFDYEHVRSPALAFYSVSLRDVLPDDVDPDLRQRIAEFEANVVDPWRRGEIEEFRERMPCGRVIEMSETHHYLFIQHRERVGREIRAFLDEDVRCEEDR